MVVVKLTFFLLGGEGELTNLSTKKKAKIDDFSSCYQKIWVASGH